MRCCPPSCAKPADACDVAVRDMVAPTAALEFYAIARSGKAQPPATAEFLKSLVAYMTERALT